MKNEWGVFARNVRGPITVALCTMILNESFCSTSCIGVCVCVFSLFTVWGFRFYTALSCPAKNLVSVKVFILKNEFIP